MSIEQLFILIIAPVLVLILFAGAVILVMRGKDDVDLTISGFGLNVGIRKGKKPDSGSKMLEEGNT
jgi:hypothetical protein